MKKVLYILLFILVPISYANAEEEVLSDKTRQLRNENCLEYCGEGYFYDRKGNKNDGQELVCTKYPLKCGYKCTYGWDIRYLVKDNYTCQEAKQRPHSIEKDGDL